ncbi:LSU ribosomal protein L10P [Stella humosa]|uniref:Large ribosomal subunit protein uL10 n=1 Tax=Stella humosa TaxID=94 RepID=A0A3N1ML22_9PROT|nr:50S ribosomal protein L10 [Stella humosa]ROQ03110.1 LSU ribosomal protein L10P [Stella humosa]BBK30200.1 50S ribosomal protein L10 [Stella humosa]
MDRSEKTKLVDSLRDTLSEATSVVVTQQSGLTVAEVTELRRRMRAAGAGFKVTKNRLARLAIAGTKFEGLGDMLTGPTAIALSKDPVAAAKVIVEYAKQNDKLKIVGGAFGNQILDIDGVKTLASLPSIEELRGKIVGILQTPAARIVGVLQAPGGQLARVLAAYARQDEAA